MFLKRLCVLSIMTIWLFSCAPDSKQSTPIAPGERADAASYKALIGPKWCLPPEEGIQGFSFSWNFLEDGSAYFTKTNLESRQIEFNQKKKWNMRAKVLTVQEENSGVEVLKKELRFTLDLNTGIQAMTWIDIAPTSNCVDGSCSSASIQAIILRECE